MAFRLPYNLYIYAPNVLWHVISYLLPFTVVYFLVLIGMGIVCLRWLWWADSRTRALREQKRIVGAAAINHLNGFSYFNPCIAKSQMISCALFFIGGTRAAYKIFIRLYRLLYGLISKHLKDCYVCKWDEHLSARIWLLELSNGGIYLLRVLLVLFFFFFPLTHRPFHLPLSQT